MAEQQEQLLSRLSEVEEQLDQAAEEQERRRLIGWFIFGKMFWVPSRHAVLINCVQ